MINSKNTNINIFVSLIMTLSLTVCVAAAEESAVTVKITKEGNFGLTESDLTQELLTGVEEMAKADALKNLRQLFVTKGNYNDQSDGDVRSSSYLITRSGKRLGVVNITFFSTTTNQDVLQGVRVFGFVDEGITTVGCFRPSSEEIPITHGACGDKVEEVFSPLPQKEAVITQQVIKDSEKKHLEKPLVESSVDKSKENVVNAPASSKKATTIDFVKLLEESTAAEALSDPRSQSTKKTFSFSEEKGQRREESRRSLVAGDLRGWVYSGMESLGIFAFFAVVVYGIFRGIKR